MLTERLATPRAVNDGDTIIAEMLIPMSPERVFKALVTDETEHWWGAPDVYLIREWQSDLRVGGHWHLYTCLPNGARLPAGGVFLEINEPWKVVKTRIYEWDAPILGSRETKVTYMLAPFTGGTRLTVRHEGFVGLRQAADEHTAGWERFLDWLADYAKLTSGIPEANIG
jgi:uncharacterized protein YndB with AHSA1/START domain